MKSDLMSQIVKKIISSGIASPNSIKGCTIDEINNLESAMNMRFPAIYKEFLLAMGHKAGSFYVGTDMFYNNLIDIQEWAKELLIEDGNQFALSNDVFVFSIHQGYQFTYFQTDKVSDDPPVYYYIEGSGIPEKKWLSFSVYLLESIADHEKVFHM